MTLRCATSEDAAAIAALAIQVFLDTYAAAGIRPDLAREAFASYSPEAFAARLAEPTRRFLLAHNDEGLCGFAEYLVAPTPLPVPLETETGCELVRLYVQPSAQGRGLGRVLLRAVEAAITPATLWLTAWDENVRAIAFYRAQGYADIGSTGYCFEGRRYANRVLIKPPPHSSASTTP